MIDLRHLVDGMKCGVGLWCPATDDDIDLVKMADCAAAASVGTVSVVPSAIPKIWPWLEHSNIEIIARFYVAPARQLTEDAVSDLVRSVKAAFKLGADGAQIFVPVRLLGAFAREMRMVRNDLFFNKKLIVGLDICDISSVDFSAVFDALIDLAADSVLFVLTRDTGDKSDFPGRVYGLLNIWRTEYTGNLCWMLNDNYYRLEQVVRLTKSLRPELIARTQLFVSARD